VEEISMKRKYLAVVVFLFFAATLLPGCASTPTQSSGLKGVVVNYSLEKTQKAALDALTVKGFDITKSDSAYVEGFRPHKVGFMVGSGGETVGIWLESLGANSTNVRVETAKSLVGIVGQKNWDQEIVSEMQKILSKKQ
jgi:uncharacterized LabA/DUF88 family protein